MSFPQLSALALELLPRSMSTISPTVFHGFVLEHGRIPPPIFVVHIHFTGANRRIDRFLEKRFASREGFRLVIRKDELFDWETFERHAKETFPFLAGRGYVQFESSHSAERDSS